MTPYLSKADVLFTDVPDSEILLGEGGPASAAKRYLDMGVHTAVVKMGEGESLGGYEREKKGWERPSRCLSSTSPVRVTPSTPPSWHAGSRGYESR